MIRFRYHRGSLEESMRTLVVTNSLESLLRDLKKQYPTLQGSTLSVRKQLKCDKYSDADPRIGWDDVYLVTAPNGVLGFANCNILSPELAST